MQVAEVKGYSALSGGYALVRGLPLGLVGGSVMYWASIWEAKLLLGGLV